MQKTQLGDSTTRWNKTWHLFSATMLRRLQPPKQSRTDDPARNGSTRVFPTRLGTHYYCCYEFKVICGESPRHSFGKIYPHIT